ncbi:MAG: NUDIX hydrolase, partial [Saprospiraceae bacterium]|nr:NUDIX hydrolase [Saprospiraceae bacterium]
MYKIYINDHPLILCQLEESHEWVGRGFLLLPYVGRRKQLLNVVDKLEKSSGAVQIVISTPDVGQLFTEFKSLFKVIKAAGGLVCNERDQLLFIHRLGRWDLPKGKRDKGEKNRRTALREVEEETGLKSEIIRKLGPTYHTYKLDNGRRVLKKTVWYIMRALTHEISLQYDEFIDDAKWMYPADFAEIEGMTYASISDVIQ